MIFWNSLYSFMVFSQIVGSNHRQLEKHLYWIILLTLFFVSGFRWAVGCDFGAYQHIFNGTTRLPWGNLTVIAVLNEIGFVGLMRGIHALGLGYSGLLVATSFIFFLGLHKLAIRQPNPLAILVLAFPLLIINLPMSAIRQGAAVGFICFAINAFCDRQLLRYILYVFAAISFHVSSLIFLLLAPFIYWNFSLKNLFLVVFPSAVLTGIAFIGSDLYIVFADRYIESGVDAFGAIFRLGTVAAAGLLFVSSFRSKWQQLYPYDYKIINIAAWAMIMTPFLLVISSTIGDRIGYYLMPFQLIIFARSQFIPSKMRAFRFIAPFIGFIVLWFVWTSNSMYFNCYVPYTNSLWGDTNTPNYDLPEYLVPD